MNEQGYVSTKLYLQKDTAGWTTMSFLFHVGKPAGWLESGFEPRYVQL